jgi:hypothetical protein
MKLNNWNFDFINGSINDKFIDKTDQSYGSILASILVLNPSKNLV